MTHPARPPVAAESARQRADRAEAIKQGWRVGQSPDAAAALRDNPDIAGDRAVALDLAYEEFCTREEAGEVLDSVAFCARFSFGASLRRLLTLHRFLDDHPDALDGVPAAWPAPGEPVGDFVPLRELGRGSFARVYLASETTAGGRPVVLKVSAAGSREADTLGPLSHPHLIPVLSSRQVGAWTVVAMPYVGTATVEDALSAVWPLGERSPPPRTAAILLEGAARGRQPTDPAFPSCAAFPIGPQTVYGDAVTAIAAGLFAAVAYLHERGIAHRDIKPSNVLLGPGGHPYLLDFNLASRVFDPWRLVGTLPYMAPEQLARMARADASPLTDGRPADVFACGVVLFELLTGRHPFGDPGQLFAHADRESVAAALLAAQRAGHPALAALNPRVRSSVCAAVERCLALDPQARPTAAELTALFSRTGPRVWRFVAPTFAAAGLLALALSYAVPGKPVAPDVPAEPTAVTAAPPSPLERGLLHYRKTEYGFAATAFREAGRGGRDGRAYSYAAYCYTVGKEHLAAISAADDAVRLGHGTAAVYANRAYNRLQTNRPPEAIGDCTEALRHDPDLLAPRLTRAVAYLQLHRATSAPVPDAAVADIDRVTAGGSSAPDVWLTAARVYLLAPGAAARRNDAARAVREAVTAGKKPEAIGRDPVLKSLADHPVYRDAMVAAPGPVVASANPHLVNPIPALLK